MASMGTSSARCAQLGNASLLWVILITFQSLRVVVSNSWEGIPNVDLTSTGDGANVLAESLRDEPVHDAEYDTNHPYPRLRRNDLPPFKGRKHRRNIPYATCGGCFCIPDASTNNMCPTNSTLPDQEKSNTAEKVARLKGQIPLNPYKLTCDPFKDEICTTTPAQEERFLGLGEVAVCAIQYQPREKDGEQNQEGKGMHDGAAYKVDDELGSSIESFAVEAERRLGEISSATIPVRGTALRGAEECPTHYRLQTYASREEAEADGAHITHAGACGVCSTTQDLAVYMAHTDMQALGTLCSTEAIVEEKRGMECYINLGMTEDCAKIWIYDSYKTRKSCMVPCLRDKLERKENNLPPPTCALNECLQCDEDESGPLFKKFAARTRRRSGMLSMIARPCQDIIDYIRHDPCP